MVQVIAIGETMAMVTPVDAGPLASAELFRVEAGGAESTVALYLQELGYATAWVSGVGADPLGRRVLDSLRSRGVDVSWVYQDPAAPTGVYFKDPGGTATTVHYYRSGSAASRMSPSDLARIPLDTAELVHITGITAALSESCLQRVEAVLAGTGTPVSFGVNSPSRSCWWSRMDRWGPPNSAANKPHSYPPSRWTWSRRWPPAPL